MTSHQKKRRGPGRAILRLHRRVGIALSAIFLLICLTGIILNHSIDLELDNKRVEADWIYRWYGIRPKGELIHYQVGSASISLFSGTLYFNSRPITSATSLHGAESLERFYLAATDTQLILISKEGELIEVLSGSALPEGKIRSIHLSDTGKAVLQTESGYFLADQDLIQWQPADSSHATKSSSPSPARPDLVAALKQTFRGDGLSWNRVVLDLHSGRFFGSIGKWIVDLTAIGLIFLTLTGIWYTTKYLKRARERALSR